PIPTHSRSSADNQKRCHQLPKRVRRYSPERSSQDSLSLETEGHPPRRIAVCAVECHDRRPLVLHWLPFPTRPLWAIVDQPRRKRRSPRTNSHGPSVGRAPEERGYQSGADTSPQPCPSARRQGVRLHFPDATPIPHHSKTLAANSHRRRQMLDTPSGSQGPPKCGTARR